MPDIGPIRTYLHCSQTSAAAPATIRYQANGAKPWRVTTAMNAFTTASATTNDTTKPIAISCRSPARDRVAVLDQLQHGRAGQRRQRQEEAEIGRGPPVDAERHRAHDRRARAADARAPSPGTGPARS